jgi:hypothetical protein
MVNQPLHSANSAAGYFLATAPWYLGVIAISCAIGYLLGKTQAVWFSPWFHRGSRSSAVKKEN